MLSGSYRAAAPRALIPGSASCHMAATIAADPLSLSAGRRVRSLAACLRGARAIHQFAGWDSANKASAAAAVGGFGGVGMRRGSASSRGQRPIADDAAAAFTAGHRTKVRTIAAPPMRMIDEINAKEDPPLRPVWTSTSMWYDLTCKGSRHSGCARILHPVRVRHGERARKTSPRRTGSRKCRPGPQAIAGQCRDRVQDIGAMPDFLGCRFLENSTPHIQTEITF